MPKLSNTQESPTQQQPGEHTNTRGSSQSVTRRNSTQNLPTTKVEPESTLENLAITKPQGSAITTTEDINIKSKQHDQGTDYMKLCTFLQNYKDKLLLAQDLQQQIGKDVIMKEQLQPSTEHQFGLDFNYLMQLRQLEAQNGKFDPEAHL